MTDKEAMQALIDGKMISDTRSPVYFLKLDFKGHLVDEDDESTDFNYSKYDTWEILP